MLVQLAKVLTELSLLVDAQVFLVSEEYHAPCGDEASKVILLQVGEVGEVDAVDFSADLGVVIEDVGGGGEEMFEVGVA